MIYDTTKVKDTFNITLDWILSRVSEYDIYAAYIGNFKVGMIYNSPLRKDKTPSFGCFYSRKTKQLLFKDHGTGQCGNVIKFIELYTGITNYSDILKDIVERLKITNDTQLVSSKQYIPSTETVIGVVRQEFTETDINYWKQFNITVETLRKFGVSSIKYYLCNGIVKSIYKEDNPMYAYKVYNHFKIYKPLADKYTKWRNNLTELDIQGFKQLPKTGDILIITKSMKDVMCLYEMGIPAISPSSESTFIPNKILEQLKKRFKRIIILFDRDSSGCKNSVKIWNKYHLKPLFINKKFKSKDISDAIKNNSFKDVKEWLINEIKNKRNE